MVTIAISPCPNDTFAFYGLLHGKTAYRKPIETDFADIEELNRCCFLGGVDFCKVSFHAYLKVRDRYTLLESGSALGFGCGPLVVAKEKFSLSALREKKIAIPGRFTTAALLLKLLLGKDLDLVECTFDRIMAAVTEGAVDAGLIIHESRFTYQQHDLVSVIDLGDWWESSWGFPIPLGGIVARKSLPPVEIRQFDDALGESIDYAWSHPDAVLPFMQKHAQEMEPNVMRNHVDLYVNRFTRGLGKEGRAAVDFLVERAREQGLLIDQ